MYKNVNTKPHPNERLLDDLIAAAVDCFRRNGFEATSVQQIVETAGVTKGAFYHYFNSKDQLLLLIHEMFLDFETGLLDSILDQPPDSALATLCEELVALNDRFLPYLSLVAEDNRRHLLKPEFARAREKRDAFEEKIIKLVEDGIAAGVFKAVENPKLVAFGIIGMCISVNRWYRPGGIPAREVGRTYAQIILSGLHV